jgi:hypothetical protein
MFLNEAGKKNTGNDNDITFIILKWNTMASVNPYLTFNSNYEQAFNFKKVSGGEFHTFSRFLKTASMPEWKFRTNSGSHHACFTADQ